MLYLIKLSYNFFFSHNKKEKNIPFANILFYYNCRNHLYCIHILTLYTQKPSHIQIIIYYIHLYIHDIIIWTNFTIIHIFFISYKNHCNIKNNFFVNTHFYTIGVFAHIFLYKKKRKQQQNKSSKLLPKIVLYNFSNVPKQNF